LPERQRLHVENTPLKLELLTFFEEEPESSPTDSSGHVSLSRTLPRCDRTLTSPDPTFTLKKLPNEVPLMDGEFEVGVFTMATIATDRFTRRAYKMERPRNPIRTSTALAFILSGNLRLGFRTA